MSTLPYGVVKWFDDKKGYGFIAQEGGGDIFVHYSSINMPGFKGLAEGGRVSFELEETKRPSGYRGQEILADTTEAANGVCMKGR